MDMAMYDFMPDFILDCEHTSVLTLLPRLEASGYMGY